MTRKGSMNRFQHRMQLQMALFDKLGYKLNAQQRILDFGCGRSGELVRKYRENGYQAFGCSLSLRKDADVIAMKENGILRLIDNTPYRVPFDDSMFDVVISDQVFEHVQEYSVALSEVKRVMKPGGIGLHIFVSRYRPIEAHTFVPFGSIVRKQWWYLLWAYLAVRKQGQGTRLPRDLASHNYNYVRNETNYLTKAEIKEHFSKYFDNAEFCEHLFLRHHHRTQFIAPLLPILPFFPPLFSAFHSRVIFLTKSS